MNYSYDTNPYDTNHTFSQYTQGRLAAVSYSTTVIGALNTQGPTFQEWYSYHQAGAQTAKRLHVSIGSGANLDGIYTYDNEGKMATVAYPNSGPTFTNSFDTMSRPTGMTQGSSSIVSGVSYGPANELLGITSYGAGETRGYNNLLQVTSIAFTGTSSVNMQYSYPAGANNGKINSQTDVVSGEVVQYTYDSLNRLATAQTTSSAWGQSYVYDPFGNLYQINVTKGSAPSLSVVVDQTTNRLSGSGNTYDANGNATNGYNYDVENRMITASPQPGTVYVYAYSPGNQRVWKGVYTNSGGTWTQTAQEVYFYGVDGKKLGTYQMAPNPPSGVTITPTELRAYFGSKPVGYAMGTNAQSAVFTPYAMDRLGSNRGVGKYYPYGQDEGTPAPNDEVKFATYTRDSATGLDYAMNRYYSNSLGRFMSPDPYRASGGPADPRSWNRYSYTRSDPVNRYDPSGRVDCGPNGPDDTGDCGGGGGGGGQPNICPPGFYWDPDSETCEPIDPVPGGGGGGGGGNGLISAQQTSNERRLRLAAINAALAAIAASHTQKGAQVPSIIWPAAISFQSMCWTYAPVTHAYQIDVTYQVLSDLGTAMSGSQLNGVNITESFPVQQGDLGDLNKQAGTWTTSNQTITPAGTFTDDLSANNFPGLTAMGSALQEFTATGSLFGAQPLDIIFPSGSVSGVNSNVYTPTSVTVNGIGPTTKCGN